MNENSILPIAPRIYDLKGHNMYVIHVRFAYPKYNALSGNEMHMHELFLLVDILYILEPNWKRDTFYY